jgi:hypothetical protein
MESKPRIQFHYLKSAHFRVIHADGAWGGLTPDANVFINFFSQRPPIPDLTVHEISADGSLGPEISDSGISKRGVVREIEAGVVLSLETTNALIQWLIEKRDALVKAREEKGKQELSDESRTSDHAPRA